MADLRNAETVTDGLEHLPGDVQAVDGWIALDERIELLAARLDSKIGAAVMQFEGRLARLERKVDRLIELNLRRGRSV